MFVRTTEVQADPAMIDDGIVVVRDEVFPVVSEMDGCVGMSLLVNRESGRCVAATAWDTEDDVMASADMVMSLRDRAVNKLGASDSEVHQWQVAVVHREHATSDGACARLTWLSGDPAMADRAVDTYRMAILPRLRQMDGFCSASFMVDRGAGRVVGTAVFDSREALAASDTDAQRIRARAADELGATIDKVEEMEVAFAHLHLPEMA